MESPKMAVVVVACHFVGPGRVCATTLRRLGAALNLARNLGGKEQVALFVTGNVPWKLRGERIERATLAEIMRDFINEGSFAGCDVRIVDGVETFSEARITTKQIAEDPSLYRSFFVVSSDFYFFSGKNTWRRRAAEQWLEVNFESVSGGGIKTWFRYGAIALIVRIAVGFGMESFLENLVTATQRKRKEGFTMDGCG